MSLLYLIKLTVEYKGIPQKQFIHTWLKQAEESLKAKEDGKILQLWKVVGERKVLYVMRVDNPDDIDRMSFSLPIVKEMGDQVELEVKPLRAYEAFATELNKKVTGEEDSFQELPTIPKAGLFYWITITIEYPGKTQDELLAVWLQEAKAAIGGKKKGSVVDIWKVIGERKVHVLMCVDSPYIVDRISFELPLMKQMGDSVQMEVTSVRPYEAFYDDLKKLAYSNLPPKSSTVLSEPKKCNYFDFFGFSLLVMRVDKPDDIDRMSFNLPIVKEMGDQVQLEVTPLRAYEAFATELNKKVTGEDDTFEELPTVPKEGLFFWLTFTIEYPGKTQDELLAVWLQEAKAAIGGKKKGSVVDIWKVIGERKVHVLMCVDSPDYIDRISFQLPLMKQMGDSVQVKVTSVRPYEAFHDDLKSWSSC
ncbi:unnamed protein product [Porites evermanni]|uniref:Muconolactone isomerase domain-containing protein n=1 Tax=Porites evermanni TaxID=104178 RepID=A0ABN8PPF4_9CNID|nr:unnamed protein product [Porites evermanni]